MKEITLFYLENCPYCKNARLALNDLIEESPIYGEIPIQWINEADPPALDGSYDYYYVPSLFLGHQKLYEAQPGQDYATIRNYLKDALDAVLALS